MIVSYVTACLSILGLLMVLFVMVINRLVKRSDPNRTKVIQVTKSSSFCYGPVLFGGVTTSSGELIIFL